jgi:DNA-binding transcriptional ArsR family regulator
MRASAAAAAPVLDALGSPRRREILRLVWDAERSAGDIHRALPEVSFGAVSQHLGVLEEAGLIARRSEGRFRYYAARRRELGPLGRWLDEMWASALGELKRLAEDEEEDEDANAREEDRRASTRAAARTPHRRAGTTTRRRPRS